MASVSVIIPTYNAATTLQRCLDSVLMQTIKVDEIIIVNDGSTDNVEDIIGKYKERIIYLSQTNEGPAVARNKGIKRAKGQFIAFLDADDYWMPAFLTTCIEFLDSHSDAIAVSAGQLIKLWGHKEKIRPSLLVGQRENDISKSTVLEDFFSFWAKHNHITTGSVVIRKEIIDMAGGQRTDFRICEDLEYWGYLATFGKWGFIPEVLLVCDPTPVVKAQGWMKKHAKRHQQTPTVEEWEARIVPRLLPNDWPSFKIVRGRIAKSIAFAKILGGDMSAAFSCTLKYGNDYPRDYMSKTMRFGARTGTLGWKFICHLLRMREQIKSLMLALPSRGK